MTTIGMYLLSIFAVLLTLTFHEYAHGYAAYRLGDPTAKMQGRLTLNPIRHLDPFGAICMVLFHFGWAKPVPINPRNFKNPKRDFAVTALAGPLMNLVVAFFSAPLALLFEKLYYNAEAGFGQNIILTALCFFLLLHEINLGIAIFNLIPIPPLDGSRLLNALLPAKTYFRLMRYERITYWILIGWLLLGSSVSAFFLAMPFVAGNPLLSAIARFFSLSGMLSDLFATVSDWILSFWLLFPFFR